MSNLNDVTEDYGMKVNTKKTKVMVLAKKENKKIEMK